MTIMIKVSFCAQREKGSDVQGREHHSTQLSVGHHLKSEYL